MSTISIWRIALKNVTKDLLKQALTCLAKEIGATVTDNIRRGLHNIDIGLTTPKLPTGIGFRVDQQGNVEVIGDRLGYEFDKIKDLATSYVNAYKAAQIARNKNPTATNKIQVRDRDVILITEWTQ